MEHLGWSHLHGHWLGAAGECKCLTFLSCPWAGRGAGQGRPAGRAVRALAVRRPALEWEGEVGTLVTPTHRGLPPRQGSALVRSICAFVSSTILKLEIDLKSEM